MNNKTCATCIDNDNGLCDRKGILIHEGDTCDQNTGYLQVIKEIEKLYELASKDEWTMNEYSKESREWKRYTDALPQEAWIV